MEALAGDPLVGRDAERSVLSDLLGRLTAGTGAVLWLEGEPGIGKSALVDALAAEATTRRVTVLRGMADEAAQPFPLYLATRCVGASVRSPDPARAEIAELVRGGAGTGVLDPVLAASERILELVDRLCGAGPVLLAAEDLHWADPASLAVWDRLGRGIDQVPLLLVGTSRPATRRPETARLRDAVVERAGVLLALPPLDDTGVGELAARVLGAQPGPDVLGELARCGGNPFFLRELLAELVREGHLQTTDGVARLRTRGEPPRTLTAAIRRRLGQLHPQTREVLRMAALLGNEFEAHELAVVTRRPVDALVAPLEETVAEGILIEVDHRLTFRHALIRQALDGELPATVRRALHAQFARALADAAAPVHAVVRHLLAVPDALEPWVARWLAGLPTQALFAEPEVAVQLLDRVLGPPVFGGEHRGVLLARSVAVRYWLGDNARATELAAEALRTGDDPDLYGRMHLYRVRATSRRAQYDNALTMALSALADERTPEPWRARIRSWAGVCLMRSARPGEAYEQAELALADGTRLDDPLAVGYARHLLSHLTTGTTSLTHLDAGLGVPATEPDAVELRLLLLHNRLALLNNLGRPEEFAQTASRTLIMASRVGAVQAGRIPWAVAMGCYDFGAWDEALVHLDSLQPPLSDARLIGRHGLAALIAAHREEWSRVREHVRAGSAVQVTPGDVRIWSGYLVAAQAIRAEADGAPAQAVELLARWLDADLGYDAKERFMWLPGLVRLALSIGDTDTARAAAAAGEDAAEPDAIPRQHATAQLCRGQLDDDIPLLRAAAETYRCHGWRMGHAVALEEVAVRLAAGSDLDAARDAFTQAVRGFADLHATWDLRRADARLRVHGIRRGSRSLYRRPVGGWAALTPTELRVAELVAQGRSNPEIAAELYMSRRTAQAHVSHILGKLELRSRTEIVKAYIER